MKGSPVKLEETGYVAVQRSPVFARLRSRSRRYLAAMTLLSLGVFSVIVAAVTRVSESLGTVLAAGNAPPAQLPLREDLKSRLAWGLVYQVKPLSDAEKALTLHAEAQRRGLKLSDEVVWYLLTHVQRDLRTLTALLEHIDRASLEQRRAVTLPLVRELLRSLEDAQP